MGCPGTTAREGAGQTRESWISFEFCLGESEVILGNLHSQGISKPTILLCLPFLGHYDRVAHASWIKNIIRD